MPGIGIQGLNRNLLLAIVTGVVLRIYAATQHPVDPDEWYNVSMAIEPTVGDLFSRWFGETASHPIGIYLINFLQFRFSGGSIGAMRIFNVILGSTTILIVYNIAKSSYTERAAIIASWSVSLLSVFIVTSSSIRGYSVMIFLCSLSIYLAIEFLRRDRDKEEFLPISLIVTMAICCYVHYFGAMFSFLLFIYVTYKISSRDYGRRTLIGMSLALAALTAPLLYAIIHFVQGGAGGTNSYIDQYATVDLPLVVIRSFLNGSNLLTLPFCFALLIRATIWVRSGSGLREMIEKNEILLFWICAPFIFSTIITVVSTPIVTPINLSLSAPAVCILIGKTIDEIVIDFPKIFPELPYEKFYAFFMFAHLILIYDIEQTSRPDLENPFKVSSEILGDSDVIIVVNSDRFVIGSPGSHPCWYCEYYKGDVVEIIDLPADSDLSDSSRQILDLHYEKEGAALVIMELSGWMPAYPESFFSGFDGELSRSLDHVKTTPGSGVRTVVFERA